MKNTLKNRKTYWIVSTFFITLLITTQTWRDTDVFWHLALGQQILQHGFPGHELFSFIPTSHHWMDQEWGFEVLVALFLSWGGYFLPSLFMGLVVSIALIIAGETYEKRYEIHPAFITFSIIFASIIGGQYFGIRAQDFTVLGLALTLYIFLRWKETHGRIIWWFIPVMFIWVNVHAGFFLGLGFAFFLIITSQYRKEIMPYIILCIAFIVTLLNPFGFHIYTYVEHTFGNPLLVQYVAEWQSPNFHTGVMRIFEIYIAMLFLVFLFSPQKPTKLELFFTIGFLWAALDAQRNISLFLITTIPLMAKYIQFCWNAYGQNISKIAKIVFHKSSHPQITRWVITTAVIIATCMNLYNLAINEKNAIRKDYPVSAVSYVLQHYKGDHIYAQDTVSGYLVEKFNTSRMVFFYDEEEVFGQKAINDYLAIHLLWPNWYNILNKYHIQHAILPTNSPEYSAFLASGWHVDCYDRVNNSAVISTPGKPITLKNIQIKNTTSTIKAC